MKEFVDLVDHFIVGALHLVEDEQTDQAADNGTDNHSSDAAPSDLGTEGAVQLENFIAEPDEPNDDDPDANALADDAVLLHFQEFVGCLNQVVAHV